MSHIDSTLLVDELNLVRDTWGELPVTVFDTETTITSRGPGAFDGARIVAAGFLEAGRMTKGRPGIVNVDIQHTAVPKLPVFGADKQVLVGHNNKFDLVHMFKAVGVEPTMNWILDHCSVIDTSINEYILTGHEAKFPSLDDCCDKYGFTHSLKGKMHEEYFSKGLGADHVPREELEKYLSADLDGTLHVYQQQMQRATPQQRAVFWVQGWATVVYALMEYHGLRFHAGMTDYLLSVTKENRDDKDEVIKRWLYSIMPQLRGHEVLISPKTLSTAFYATPGIKVSSTKVVGKYKNGKPKSRIVTETVVPSTGIPVPHGVKPGAHGSFPVDDRALEHIHMRHKGTTWAKVAEIIRSWRRDAKITSTYLEPITQALDTDHKTYIMHPHYHQTVSATGRTSSTKPNGQNMPPEIKALVKYDQVLNFDFKQLEVWAAATLSGDSQMLRDVRTSDIHFETGKVTMGWTNPGAVPKEDRRIIKNMNFGIIYGGGAKTISAQTGVDQAKVQKHIDYFYSRYPSFQRWQENNISTVNASPKHSGKPDGDGRMHYAASMRTVWGRTYTFRQKWVKWKKDYSFSPPEIKNYPVQGFATGDVVPLFLVYMLIYRGGWNHGEPFSAIHDSFSAYVDPDDISWWTSTIPDGLAEIGILIENVYGVGVSVPLDGETHITDHWD